MSTKGHLRKSGRVFVRVTVDRQHDEYRGDVFWYEAHGGEIVPYRTPIDHHSIQRIRIPSVLVAFQDVRSPSTPDKIDAAAGVLIKMSPVHDLSSGTSGPGGRLHVERIVSVPSGSEAARAVRGSEVDEHAKHELDLYAENTSELYAQKKSILANIQRRHKNGTYDPARAPQLWMYWVDAASKRYHKEFGGSPEMFNKPTREALARELADRYKSGHE
jgi:hypothetical protein